MTSRKHPSRMKYESKETFDVEYSKSRFGSQSYSCTSKKYAICRVDEDFKSFRKCDDDARVREKCDDDNSDNKSDVTIFFDDEEEPGSQHETQKKEEHTASAAQAWLSRVKPTEKDLITTTPQHNNNEDNTSSDEDSSDDHNSDEDSSDEDSSKEASSEEHNSDEDNSDEDNSDEHHTESKQSTKSPKSKSKSNPKPKHKPSSSPNHSRTETSQSCWEILQTPTGSILKMGATCAIIEARIEDTTRAELIETSRADLSIIPFHGRLSRRYEFEVQSLARHNKSMANLDYFCELMRLNNKRMEEITEQLNESMAKLDHFLELSQLNNKKMEEMAERLATLGGWRGVANLLAQRDRDEDVENEKRRKKSKCHDSELLCKEAGEEKDEVSGCDAGPLEDL